MDQIASQTPGDEVFDALAVGTRNQSLEMLGKPFDRERRVEGLLRIEGVLSLPLLFLFGAIIGEAARHGGSAALYGVLLGWLTVWQGRLRERRIRTITLDYAAQLIKVDSVHITCRI